MKKLKSCNPNSTPSTNQSKTEAGRKNLTPASEPENRFPHWFNHGWELIEKKPTEWTNVKKYPLPPREIGNQHQDPSTISFWTAITECPKKTERILSSKLDTLDPRIRELHLESGNHLITQEIARIENFFKCRIQQALTPLAAIQGGVRC
jgi:hypothetical protein